MRSRGVKLFLGTNSHFEYMNVIMHATFGENWQSLFDLKLANCRKPYFFRSTAYPFYAVDVSKRDFKGTEIKQGADLNADDAFLEGNANTAHEYFRSTLGKDVVRVAYFGDHFWSDAHASATFQPQGTPAQPKWDGIAVLEEMWWIDNESSEGSDPLLIDNSRFWGDSFFFDTVNNQQVRNYFMAELDKVARYAVPFVKNIKRLIK